MRDAATTASFVDRIHEELNRRGASLVIAGRRTEAVNWLKSVGMEEEEFVDRFFPTLRQAVQAFKIEFPPGDLQQSTAKER